MKYIKNFERMKIVPQIDDYVIMITRNEILDDFISSNVGQITSFDGQSTIRVKYEDIPIDLSSSFTDNTRKFLIELIKDISKNKEDLEMKISSQKYNL